MILSIKKPKRFFFAIINTSDAYSTTLYVSDKNNRTISYFSKFLEYILSLNHRLSMPEAMALDIRRQPKGWRSGWACSASRQGGGVASKPSGPITIRLLFLVIFPNWRFRVGVGVAPVSRSSASLAIRAAFSSVRDCPRPIIIGGQGLGRRLPQCGFKTVLKMLRACAGFQHGYLALVLGAASF